MRAWLAQGDFAALVTALGQQHHAEEQMSSPHVGEGVGGAVASTSGLRNAFAALASEMRLLYLASTGVDPLGTTNAVNQLGGV